MNEFFEAIENHIEVSVALAVFIIWALEIIFKNRQK